MKLIPKSFTKFINKVRTEQRGAETPEWIAAVAVLLILLLAFSFAMDARGAGVGQGIVDQITCKVSAWTGGSGCGSASSTTTADDGSVGGGSTNDGSGSTQPISTGDGNSGGDGSDDGGGGFLGWLGDAGSSVWNHSVDFVEGVFIDGLWEDVKGTVVMVWDGSVMLPGSGHILDFVGLADRDATFDKYADLWDHMKERGFGGTLWDLTLREPVELWQNGEPGSAIGYGVYNIGMLFVPGDEAAKLSKFTKVEQILPDGTARLVLAVERLSPDEIAGLIARSEDLLPNELADLRRGVDALSDAELENLRKLIRDKSPEELAEMGLDVDDLKQVGICSFSAHTPVTTISGLRPISQLAIGEMVLAYDEHENKVGYYPVTATWVHEDPLIVTLTIDGERIETTPGHPFYVNGEWIFARDLWVGASVTDGNSGSGIVQQIEILPQTKMMYNLTVDTAHTYYVGSGQWLVHNAGDCPIDSARTVPATEDWIGDFNRKPTPNNTNRDKFEIEHTGPENVEVKGGGEKIWADGVDVDRSLLQEAKFIENPDRSPFIPDSNAPDFIREKITAEVDNEFRRYAAVINDSTTPVKSLEVIINNPQAAPFFQNLLDKYNIPGEVIVRP